MERKDKKENSMKLINQTNLYYSKELLNFDDDCTLDVNLLNLPDDSIEG